MLGLLELRRLIRRLRPDIVHAHSSKAGILARAAAALCRVRVVVFTAHGWAFKAEPGLKSRLYLLADRVVRRVTTEVICVSETERREGLAARTCVEDRTVVIRNGVEPESFPVRVHAAVERPRLVSLGRFKAPKDFGTLLEALAQLRDVPFEAVLVGDGPQRRALERAAQELGLSDVVEFAGERDDVPSLLAGADCFVLSSTSEGMPISVLEAMAAGLPVVASDVGGVHELVREGETGFLVPAQDAAALARAIRPVLADHHERARLGANGRSDVEATFTVARVRRQHADLYHRLLSVTTS